MAGNPFEVATLNPLQALLAGGQGYEQANKSYKQEQLKTGLQQLLGGGAPLDPNAAASLYLQHGDASTGAQFLGMANTAERNKLQDKRDERDFSFRQDESKRAQSNADRSFGLQSAASKRADEDKFTVQKVENADGSTSFFKYNGRTGDIAPIGTPAPAVPGNPFSNGAGKLTEGEGKAGGFTDRMLQAEAVLSGVAPAGGIGPVAGLDRQGTNWAQRDLHQAPFGLSNSLISSEQQQFNQAKNNFINSQLRKESGAAIGKDEYAAADRQYFPQPGDSDATIKQKAENRRASIEAMGRESGRAYKPKINFREDGTLGGYGQSVQAPADPTVPVAPAPPKPGQLMQGYRFKGGDPGDPASWVKAQ